MSRSLFLVFAVSLAATLGIVAWAWVSAGRMRSAHVDQGRAHAARLLEQTGTLPSELRESSGVAVSRTQPGTLWSHNDSGDAPRLYAIDLSGRLIATVRVSGATASDWEDIAAGPCPGAAASDPRRNACLYVADIGDNQAVRETLAIFIIDEPLLDGTPRTPREAAARALRFRYPDGPRDSEAVAVLPDGTVTIVTKGRSGTIQIYDLPAGDVAAAVGAGDILTAVPRGELDVAPEPGIGRYVTGAAVSPDGTTLAVRTYTEVFFVERMTNAGEPGWRSLDRRCFLGYAEPVGEAIDYLDADTLVLTSEYGPLRPGPIHRVQC